MNKKLKYFLLSIFIILVSSSALFAQLPAEKIKKIDSLFIAWNSPDHPGGAVGVMLDGKTIYLQAFGLASLEYLVPNTYSTSFNIASVSKQFTAFAICLLQQQGKLSVDDDIRKYLPELPEFKYKITIRHLLHHTSGLRSLHTMLHLAGWRSDDARSNEDLMRFMKKQKDLNFVPGSEYMYCNTGYILMAEIIEKFTGEDFCKWMEKSVFLPFGMHHTYVERQYNRVAKNNATSYYKSKSGEFRRAVEYWGYVGSGNIHTNVTDLLIWLEQLRDPDPQWKNSFEMLKTLDSLNNGEPNNYAFGVRIDKYKGELRIGHGGSIGGFRSQVYTFPEAKLSLVILSNFSSSNPGEKANLITDIILNKKTEKTLQKKYKLSIEKFDRLAGRYKFQTDEHNGIDIFRIGNTFFAEENGGKRIALKPVSENEFIANKGNAKLKFKKKKHSVTIEYFDVKNKQKRKGRRVKEFKETPEIQMAICGTYWSPELETQYVLFIKDKKLMAHHPRHGDFKIRYIRDDEFNGAPSFFRFFKAKRNEKGEVIGILVSNSRVRDLWFEKVD